MLRQKKQKKETEKPHNKARARAATATTTSYNKPQNPIQNNFSPSPSTPPHRGWQAVLQGHTEVLVVSLRLVITVLALLGLLSKPLALHLRHVQLQRTQINK